MQGVLGAVVRAEQRLAWAKILTRLGAASRIRAVLGREHSLVLPRLVGELLCAAVVSIPEPLIARAEMQVCMHLAVLFYTAYWWSQGFGWHFVQQPTELGQNVGADSCLCRRLTGYAHRRQGGRRRQEHFH